MKQTEWLVSLWFVIHCNISHMVHIVTRNGLPPIGDITGVQMTCIFNIMAVFSSIVIPLKTPIGHKPQVLLYGIRLRFPRHRLTRVLGLNTNLKWESPLKCCFSLGNQPHMYCKEIHYIKPFAKLPTFSSIKPQSIQKSSGVSSPKT